MLPAVADAIIVGAGVMGASLAYHLTRLGLNDVVLLEKEALAGTGSTSKALGGIRAQFGTEINIQLSLKSMDILESLADEMREQVEYIKAGYLFLTSSQKNWKILEELVEIQRKEGAEVMIISREEIEKRAPYVASEDLLGGTFGPRDGFIDPAGLTHAFLGAALKKGAQIFYNTEMTGIIISGKKVIGIETAKGKIKSEVVINAAGPYAASVAARAGIKLPVEPVRRHIALTGDVDSLPSLISMTIDYDTGLLIRREGNAVAIACADPEEKPGFNTTVDRKFFEFIAAKILKRFPFLEDSGINTKKSWAGLYEVTPDNHPVLGRAEELEGFYLANGFSGHGVMHSPATGLALSELIVKGRAESIDISCLSLKRFREGKLLIEKTVL